MSYVIQNCPAFVLMRTATSGTYFDMCGNAKGHIKCADCTDCVLKQIVEKCRKTVKIFSAESGTQPYAGGRCTEAEGILKLLDIQGVE